MSLRPGGGVRKGGRGQDRTGKHKKGMDLLSARRRREEGFVEVRMNKRGNALSRKRRDSLGSILQSEDVDVGPPYCRQHGVGIPPESAHNQQEKIKEMSQHLWSEHPCAQIKSASYFRKITSAGENTPVDLVIEAGIVPLLIQFLPRQDVPTLQLEAAATLVNISAGTTEHTQALIDHSAIPHLIHLLNSPTEELREKAVLTLGNIAGDSSQCRDAVLSSGILIPLLSLLNPRSRMMMLRNATWTLANLFHPTPEIDQIEPALSVLGKLVYSNDDTILWNSCWALAGLFGGKNYRMEDIFGGGNICSRLADLIMHMAPEVQMVALKAVANISAGDDSQAQLVIDNEMLPSLLHILAHHHHHHHHHHESSIRRVACRILSNITAGNKSQVQSVIDSNIIPALVSLLKNDEFDVKRESAWAILNATSGGTFEQIHFIVNQGCIPLLCDLLGSEDAEVVMVCLQAIENMLKVGEAEKELGSKDTMTNVYAREVDDCDGRSKIENLHLHTLPSISHAAIRILERYWDGDDDDDDDNDNGDDDDYEEDKGEDGEGDDDAEKNTNVLNSVDCEPSNRDDNDSVDNGFVGR